MIKVTVELIPFGIGSPQKIGEVLIANMGGDRDVAKYKGLIYQSDENGKDLPTRTVVIPNFERQKGVMALLASVLTSDEENSHEMGR